MACDPFLRQELKKIEDLISAYLDALLSFEGPAPVASYTLDTGQTRQTVTRAQLGEMRTMLDFLNSKRDDLVARCGYTGDGTYVGRGGSYVVPLA